MAFEAVGHLKALLLQSEQALNIIRSDTTYQSSLNKSTAQILVTYSQTLTKFGWTIWIFTNQEV